MASFMPISNFRFFVLVTLIAFLSLSEPLFLPACHARTATIVLDPGHGGNDNGAGRNGGLAEKQFSLALAQKIAGLLAAHHRVELTRTSDITLAPADRAAVANHLRADLMISIHAAVAPYCSDRTAAVYFHDDERLSFPPEIAIPGTVAESDADQPAWARLQIRHQHQSRYLAATLKQSLEDSETFDSVAVYGVPLAPLMGADLPAVLVEVGCIHPTAAPGQSTRGKQLNAYAESIAKAIETAVTGLVR